MTLKSFIGLVGVIAAAAGLLALLLPISLDVTAQSPYQQGEQLTCGSGMAQRLDNSRAEDNYNQNMGSLTGRDRDTNYAEQCETKVSARRVWAIPLAVIGGVLAIGALVVQSPRSGAPPPPSRA